MTNNNCLYKIKPSTNLTKILAEYKQKGKRIVQCHGVFDLLHLGHIRHFHQAKKEGDVLVVTVTSDRYVRRGPGRPFFNERLRAEALASLSVVDYVAIDDAPTAVRSIKAFKPDVYAKGVDYKEKEKDITGKIYDEEEAVKSVGGRLVFTEDIIFSSTKLINDYFDVYPPETRRYLQTMARKYPIESIIERLKTLTKLKVLVIGDCIIDEYHYCRPMGKSAKEQLVVNRYISEEKFAGGSLATANNVASVCGQVDLVTVLGRKYPHEEFIKEKLGSNVKPIFFHRSDACTIVKRRFVNEEDKKKLFEICHIQDEDIPKSVEERIFHFLKNTIRDYNLVVVSDYGHGLMTQRLIRVICSKAKYLAINVQTNSANTGFNLVTKYPAADCVCVDELELRFATHDKSSDLRVLAKKVYQEIGCRQIIATRGPRGSLCYGGNGGFHEAPALSQHVIDKVGAGDAFYAFVAPCFSAGMPQDLVSFIGNAVGALAVQIICNREPVNYVNLVKFMTRLLK